VGTTPGAGSGRAAGRGSARERPRDVEELLRDARAAIERLTPERAYQATREGALLVDIRTDAQRQRDGAIPGAAVVERNVLEWRLDPACPDCDPDLARSDRTVIVLCDEGYQSSLAAATLAGFGRPAADVIGGMQGWLAADLPREPMAVD
jgi:rhodanese-related sulfurtransferase